MREIRIHARDLPQAEIVRAAASKENPEHG